MGYSSIDTFLATPSGYNFVDVCTWYKIALLDILSLGVIPTIFFASTLRYYYLYYLPEFHPITWPFSILLGLIGFAFTAVSCIFDICKFIITGLAAIVIVPIALVVYLIRDAMRAQKSLCKF